MIATTMIEEEKTIIKQYSFMTNTRTNIRLAFMTQLWKWCYNALMMLFVIGEKLGVMLTVAEERSDNNAE